MSGGHLSKEFFELVKAIGESRSKQEEDKIIVNEISMLKANLLQPHISPKKMKEYMIRAVYVEMLGHDAAFAYIHAVKLTHEKNLLAKRIGYLTCNLFLHKEHELMLLLINTMQRDLQSANHLEVCAALTSVCRLVNMEMIPAIEPLVFKLLSHQQEVVRKKAVIAVHRFYKLTPESIMDQKELIRKVLCDPDPSVMGASLHILFEVAKAHPSTCKDLVPSFVSILKQITEHRLPRDFDYHRMPAPWLQVKLLSILGLLGTADQTASEQMYEILHECMRRADGGVNVGYAIIYECVKCITRIYPDHGLLEVAASNISRFISSENHNLKYLGVTGLAQIVQVNAFYAADHQMVVVDCLEDPDETLKRKTLDLLFRMTNPQNVTVVVDKLTFHLRTSVDVHLRRELVQRITSLAERFAPNNEWYLNTMNTVFELGGDLVPADTAYNLMRLVAEGTGEDDAADQAFRTFAVNTYLKLLEKPSVPDVLMQVIGWVVGEYARLANVDGYTLEDVVDLLCDCVDRQFEDQSTRGYLVNAIMKLVGQSGLKSSAVAAIIRSHRSSRLTDLQQRCYEFEQLWQTPALMQKVLPYDASCEDIDMKKDLAFLDAYVHRKLGEGAKPYLDTSERMANADFNGPQVIDTETRPTLNFTPYNAPSKPQPGGYPSAGNDSIGGMGGGGGGGGGAPEPPQQTGLNVSGPRKWGPSGYNNPSGGAREQPQERPAERPALPVAGDVSGLFGQTPKPAATLPKAAEPEQMSERQKMAAALFGGIGNAGATAPSVTATPAPKKAPEPPQPQPATQVAPTPPQPSGPVDLLDLDGGGGGGFTAAAPPPAAAPADNDMLLGGDLLDMDVTPSPAPSAGLVQQQQQPPAPVAPAPAAAAPILGPLQVTTAQVGSMWGQLPSELRTQFRTSISSCQELMQRLSSSLNVHPVEIIGSEGIAAGRVLPGTEPCFLHGKLAPQRLDLLVRCRDPGVAQQVSNLCSQVLA